MVGYHLVRVANMALRVVNASYGDLRIRHLDAAVLMVIAANPGITQSTIARMVKMERSNVAPIITRLSDRNWIDRRPGRGKTIGLYLSPEGAVIMPQIQAASRAGEEVIAEAVGSDGYAEMLRNLRRIP